MGAPDEDEEGVGFVVVVPNGFLGASLDMGGYDDEALFGFVVFSVVFTPNGLMGASLDMGGYDDEALFGFVVFSVAVGCVAIGFEDAVTNCEPPNGFEL